MPGTQHRSTDMTVSVYQPLVRGGAHLHDLNDTIERYSHTIQAFGGFDRMTLTLRDYEESLFDWFENGLGRHIVVRDDALSVVWEGFVDSIELRQAGLSLTRGPLSNIVNRVRAVYSSIDTTTSPPTLGIRKRTDWAEDVESQGEYGIWPQVISVAGVTDANADVLRDTRLLEYAQPETTQSFNGGGGEQTLNVQASGYFHAMQYPYNYTSAGGTVNASVQLARLVAADPNGWISTDTSRIDTNTLAVSQWENDDAHADGLIKGLVAMGDAAANRWLFGIYDDRQARYGIMPDAAAYEIRLADPRQVVLNRSGGEVQPWSLRPGQWLFFSDFLAGRISDALALRTDPRMLFIETVSYQTPGTFLINGGKVDTLAQKVARFGLAGTSA